MKKLIVTILTLPLICLGAGGDIDESIADHVIKWKDVHLTSTIMDTINASPYEALIAPGSGYSYAVYDVICHNDFNTTDFEAGSGTLDVRFASLTGSLIAQFTNAFLEADEDAFGKAYGRDVVTAENQSVVVTTSADVTDGDGQMNCRVYYRIIQSSDI